MTSIQTKRVLSLLSYSLARQHLFFLFILRIHRNEFIELGNRNRQPLTHDELILEAFLICEYRKLIFWLWRIIMHEVIQKRTRTLKSLIFLLDSIPYHESFLSEFLKQEMFYFLAVLVCFTTYHQESSQYSISTCQYIDHSFCPQSSLK